MDASHYDNSISASNLTKVYGSSTAVDSLAIDVKSGDLFGFLGPNGAGKTTTIRMLCGLLLPTAGKAKVAGYDVINDSLKIRRIIGVIPESGSFYNYMNAEEYLLYFAALYGIKGQESKKRVEGLLEKVGLAGKSFAPIGYYSRGMKQRLSLARALINEPKILFLDEPTLGLDPKGQHDIQRILIQLNHEKGITIFLSSHALGEVSSLCNRVAIVNHGKLVAQGAIDELRQLAGESRRAIIRVLNTPEAKKALFALPYPVDADESDNLLSVIIQDPPDSVNAILSGLEKLGFQIYEIRRLDISLEEIFLKLTGKIEGGLQVQLHRSHDDLEIE
jgi:ABC-type multidrug transport system ATPase subunit